MKTITCFVACVLLLTGCSSYNPFKPNYRSTIFGSSYAEKLALTYFETPKQLGTMIADHRISLIIALEKTAVGDKWAFAKVTTERDAILYDMLIISDCLYGEFKDQLYDGKAKLDTGAKVLDLALTGTAVAVGDKGTKTALAAAATFLGGTKLAIDENFYAKQTTASLIAVMDGERATIKQLLVEGMKKDASEFTLNEGLSLAQRYHRAGSVVDAVVALNRLSTKDADIKVKALQDAETKAAK